MAPATNSPALDSKHKKKDFSKKAPPKKPLTTQERLRRLFTSLCAQIDGGHFANAIKTCEKILRLEPQDADARQTKLFLLLQTEQYAAALSLLDSDGTSEFYSFERAYSLYRLQNEEEARSVLMNIKQQKGDNDRGVMHLEAQLCYRDGSYAEAVEIYNALLESAEPDSEEYSDVLTNLQAAQQYLEFINSGYRRVLDALPTNISTMIESNPPPVLSVKSTTSKSPPMQVVPTENPKKVRKSRMPPGVVPGVTPPPDPERWIKKTERSSYTHGKKRNKGGGATQGSAVVEPPSSVSKPPGVKGKKRK